MRYSQKLKNHRFWKSFVYIFHPVNLNFFKNKKRLEHLNVLVHIFFVSGVFENFDVHFCTLKFNFLSLI